MSGSAHATSASLTLCRRQVKNATENVSSSRQRQWQETSILPEQKCAISPDRSPDRAHPMKLSCMPCCRNCGLVLPRHLHHLVPQCPKPLAALPAPTSSQARFGSVRSSSSHCSGLQVLPPSSARWVSAGAWASAGSSSSGPGGGHLRSDRLRRPARGQHNRKWIHHR